MRKKEVLGCALMMGALVLPMSLEAKVAANSFYDNQTNAQRADITNWVASTPAQISNNMPRKRLIPIICMGNAMLFNGGIPFGEFPRQRESLCKS